MAREQEGRCERRRPRSSSSEPFVQVPARNRRIRVAVLQRSPPPFDLRRRVPLQRPDAVHVVARKRDPPVPSRADAASISSVHVRCSPSRPPHGRLALSLLAIRRLRPPPARQRRNALPHLSSSTRHRALVLLQRSHLWPLRRSQHLGWVRDEWEEAQLAAGGHAPAVGADDVWIPGVAAGSLCEYSGGRRSVRSCERSEGSK